MKQTFTQAYIFSSNLVSNVIDKFLPSYLFCVSKQLTSSQYSSLDFRHLLRSNWNIFSKFSKFDKTSVTSDSEKERSSPSPALGICEFKFILGKQNIPHTSSTLLSLKMCMKYVQYCYALGICEHQFVQGNNSFSTLLTLQS